LAFGDINSFMFCIFCSFYCLHKCLVIIRAVIGNCTKIDISNANTVFRLSNGVRCLFQINQVNAYGCAVEISDGNCISFIDMGIFK